MDVDTGELFTISEWTIPTDVNSDISIVQRQLTSIEQELNYLVKLRHQNLVHYVNIRNNLSDEKAITIQILHEFVYGRCKPIKKLKQFTNLDLFRFKLHRFISHRKYSNRCGSITSYCNGCIIRFGLPPS